MLLMLCTVVLREGLIASIPDARLDLSAASGTEPPLSSLTELRDLITAQARVSEEECSELAQL